MSIPQHLSQSNDKEEINKIISTFRDLSKKDKLALISYLVDELKKQHELSDDEILGKKDIKVPVGIFSNAQLSALEAIAKYLHEDLKLKFSKIAELLNRSNKTIWTTYNNASKKMPSPFGNISKEIMIAVSAFSDRSYSTLESLVGFMKDLGYANHEVAKMLRLDDRTIWTVYDRVKKKRGAR